MRERNAQSTRDFVFFKNSLAIFKKNRFQKKIQKIIDFLSKLTT